MTEKQLLPTETQSKVYLGPSAQQKWMRRGVPRDIDVVLLTHPRDRADVVRMFPWAGTLDGDALADLLDCLQPVYGEIIEAKGINIGILFLPILAQDMIDPRKRASSRRRMENEGLAKAAAMGARHVCLGGLTGALTHYGRRIEARSKELDIELTTGHAVTSVSIVRQVDKALSESGLNGSDVALAILGVGSVGAGVARLLARSSSATRPAELILVDTLQQQDRLRAIAGEVAACSSMRVSVEVLPTRHALPDDSRCYRDANVIVSAVSTPSILDIDLVRAGTILIDDSQPYCWNRDAAWARVRARGDILPCDAGLVDVREIAYRSFFPFDFSDDVGHGSAVSWSCLAEGLLRASLPQLVSNIGEADATQLLAYEQAFDNMKFGIPPLQCGKHVLDVAAFRRFLRDAAGPSGVSGDRS
ncbi:hypothetical protein LGM43_10345 [Burkholderia seminalis]|uniref:hypothetical protein n=1 Tax=Burkholderia seminalis TaxID=488731 RepID=UPI001CF40049|nr:hypothetical protein [Burkholderia seminalis]MCA7950673.1 hypothetical protein [Burkholderia seminalis]MDN7589580.1 hypothetical protein [Burkholderia seminalis]